MTTACHSIHRCEELRNVDSLMESYSQTISTVIDLVTNAPDVVVDRLWGSFLNVDESCKSACSSSTRFKFLCTQCKCLSLLSDMELEKPFMIEQGTLMGTNMSVSKMKDTSSLKIVIDNDLRNETIRLTNVEKKMLECGTPDTREMLFLKCDPTTCQILVSWLVESAMKDGHSLMSAYVCGGSVYQLKKVRNSLLNIDQKLLTNENCFSITAQTIICLRQLTKYHFVHGNPSPSSLRISHTPISKMMNGVHIYGQITLGIEPGENSSITTWKTRVCSNTSRWRLNTLTPTMENKWIASKVTLYSIPEDTKDTFLARRSAGIPIYPGSFDLYCIVVGLWCDPKFKTSVEKLGWSSLWVGSGDLETVETRILGWKAKNHNLYPSFEDIIKMISGLWLRCDAIEVMWDTVVKISKQSR